MPDDPGDDHQAGAARPSSGVATGWLIAGRYRVLDRLGSGAMADVYRAHDETLDRDVALKVFRAVMDDADTAGNARRELELQALAQLSHPNLITLFDGSVSDSDGPAFLALELVEGPTLAAVLREGALPEPQVRQIGTQIADALAYVHQRGMVHRDVKPANILLGSDSAGDPSMVRARLSDFGIVRLVDDSAEVTAADLTVGTAYYLAPEQARSAAVGPEADVYSLGLVLLEALTGVRAFEGPLHEVLAARLNRDPHIPADLPEPWSALLPAMTASDPARRPSAGQVTRALRSPLTSGALPVAGAAALGVGVGAGIAAGLAGPAFAANATAAPPGATTAAATQTAALPRPDASTVRPPASFPAPDDQSSDPEPEQAGSHRLTGLLIAAAVFLAIIAGAGWFLFRPAGHPTPHQGRPGTTARTSAPGSSHRNTANARHRHAVASAPTQPVNRTFHGTRGAPPAHRPSRQASTSNAGPTTSAAPTTARPSRPGTSSRPATSSPPTTSAAPSSPTSAPPTTSSATPPNAGNSSPGQSQTADIAEPAAVNP